LTLSFYPFWGGFVLMGLILLVTRRRFTWRVLRLSISGGVVFGLQVVLFFMAVKLTDVANVMVISALSPGLILLAAGPIFGEVVDARKVLWTGAAICGVVVVVLGSAGTRAWSPKGDLLAFGTLFTTAGYWLILKQVRARHHLGTIEYLAGVMLIAGVVFTPIAALGGGEISGMPAMDWLWLGLFVVFPGGIGHLLIGWAQRYVDVSLSSLLTLVSPVIGSALAWMILGESLHPFQMLGGVIVLVSIGTVLRTSALPVEDLEPAVPPPAAA